MTPRRERVQHQAMEVLGEAIQNLKDPRVGFATVTKVRVSPDLRHARVSVSVMGSDEEQEETMDGLRSAGSYLRSELGRQMRLRYLPELHFELDETSARAERVEEILHHIHEAEDGGSEGG